MLYFHLHNINPGYNDSISKRINILTVYKNKFFFSVILCMQYFMSCSILTVYKKMSFFQLFSTCSVLWRRRKGGPVIATGPATSPVLTTDIKRDKDPDAPVLLEPNWQIEFHQSKKAAINPLMRILRERKLEDKTGIAPFKVPFKMTIEKGKLYKWCSCGRSKAQVCALNKRKLKEKHFFFLVPKLPSKLNILYN